MVRCRTCRTYSPPDYVLFNKLEFDDKANWKLIGETSMEGYHIKALHNQSFYPTATTT